MSKSKKVIGENTNAETNCKEKCVNCEFCKFLCCPNLFKNDKFLLEMLVEYTQHNYPHSCEVIYTVSRGKIVVSDKTENFIDSEGKAIIVRRN